MFYPPATTGASTAGVEFNDSARLEQGGLAYIERWTKELGLFKLWQECKP